MSKKISITIILLTFACCCHFKEQSNSYFSFSFLNYPREGFHCIGEFRAGSELACALRCDRYNTCEEAIFNLALNKCTLYPKRDKCSKTPYADEKEEKSGICMMKKIAIRRNKGQEPSCTSTASTSKVEGQKYTSGKSCHDIFKSDSSSPSGIYEVNGGKMTWKTRCKMRGFSECGDGVWELIMKVKNRKQTFHYNSSYWTSQAPYGSVEKGGEFKLPGYWLRNFTRICVRMTFGANSSTSHTAIVVGYTGQSLYSVMNKGIQKTWPADVTSITTPINIDKSCLEKGLNLHGSSPWMIKSRVGVASELKKCALPYMVRGVGFGSPQRPKMNCGEIIISYKDNPPRNYSIQSFPALCKIYIQ